MSGIPAPALAMLWTPADALGRAEINAGHARTAALHRAALDAEDGARFAAAFRALCRHLAAQFALEERLMAARGFPPWRLHAAEHAGLLAACDRLRRGDAGAARDFLAGRFMAWFRQHLATMDDATARFLNGERFLGCALMCGKHGLPPGVRPSCAMGRGLVMPAEAEPAALPPPAPPLLPRLCGEAAAARIGCVG